ncbi:hypothetical protein TRFO_29923 [Tritrichomonas foetus]|uniref:Uncharacterized protein n=1 Tax=Tritrichomonas foetus TaxID=1144522 RepID=A0A1J4JUH0_9EUKA|nr:hypothetical protein TRFO_29923 [Tritrichomonas foetus]|eukprot:OHT02799.1 hypothetical protein TRFO_29923 [Tritrichomonas foetus]
MNGAGSVTSSRSGRRRSNHVFHAEPPLERQSELIDSYFQEILNLLLNEIQGQNGDGPDGMNNKKRNKNKSFNSTATLISDSIHKLFCDTWRSIRAAQKADDAVEEQHLKEFLLKQFDNFRANMDNLRSQQIDLLIDLIKVRGDPITNSLFFSSTKLLNDLIILYCEDLFEIIAKNREYKDSDFAESITENLIEKISLFSNGLSKFHYTLVSNFDQFLAPEIDEDLSSDQLADLYADKIDEALKGFQQASELFHQELKQITAFTFRLFQSYPFEAEEEGFFDVISLFKPSIDIFISLCSTLSARLAELGEPQDYSEYDDDDWEKLIKEQQVEFMKSEVSKEGDTLVASLNQFWRYAAEQSELDKKSQIDIQFENIGDLLFTTIEERFNSQDPTLKATDVSLPFLTAVEYNDDNFDQFRDLLITQIEQCSSNLENLRRKQLKLLSNQPKEEEDLDYYLIDSKDLSKEIQDRALDLNVALYQGRKASFILSQRPKPINDDYSYYSDDEESPEQSDVFLLYDNEESTAIKSHLEAIIDLNKNIYSSVEVPFSPGMAPKQRKTATTISDTASVFSVGSSTISKKSKKSTMTKAVMSKIAQHMDQFTRTQVNAIEDAMASTYLQLFASIKGTLIAAIRLSEYQDAAEINMRMHQQCLEYLNHLNETKKRANRDLDVDMLKATDDRIKEMQAQSTNDLERCINESLRNLIDMTITNYERNLEDITDKYNILIDNEKKALQSTASKMMTDTHIPQLVLIEKQRLIAKEKEKMRKQTQFQHIEDSIREFASKGDYNRAKMEKEKLEIAKEEDLRKRIIDMDKSFDTKKNNIIQEQSKDLQLLEERYNLKLERIKADKSQEFTEQLNTLASSIRSSLQRHAQFALKILPLDQQGKRNLPLQFEKIANEIVSNRARKGNRLATIATQTKKSVV